MTIPWDTLGKSSPVLVQLAMAAATFFLACIAYKQFRDSISQREKALALRVHYYLQTRHGTLKRQLDIIRQKGPGSELPIEDDAIRQAEVFFTFPRNAREKLINSSNEFNELRRKQKQRTSRDYERMEQLVQDMLGILENEISKVKTRLDKS